MKNEENDKRIPTIYKLSVRRKQANDNPSNVTAIEKA